MHPKANHPLQFDTAWQAIDALDPKVKPGAMTAVLRAYDAPDGRIDGNLWMPVTHYNQRGALLNGLVQRGWLFEVQRTRATGTGAKNRGGGVGIYEVTPRGRSVARAYRERYPDGYPTHAAGIVSPLQASLFEGGS